MSITGFLEKGTKMLDADNRVAQLDATRRERTLIQTGKLTEIWVICSDGLRREMVVADLQPYEEPDWLE